MTTKQVQSLEEYVHELKHNSTGNYLPNMVDFVADMYKPNGKREIGRISFYDIFYEMIPLSGVVTQDNISSSLDGKYVTKSEIEQIKSVFKGSLGDFNSTSAFRTALNNMIADKKEAGRYYATLYGSLIFVTLALLDKSSGTYSQWVEGSIIKGSDGELYLNNELGVRICGRVGLGNTWGVWRANVLDDELPIAATKAHDGLMSKEDKAALEDLKSQSSDNLQKYLHCETITDSQGNQVEAIKPKCIDYGVWVSGCFNFDEYFTPFPKNYIVWNKVALSEYGHYSTDKTGCVKMVGTYAMDTACVKDLYVKNLHSSLQSNTMDEIKVDSILPKSEGEYANIYLGSGITFHGNPNYSLIKYEEIDLSQYGFGNRTINGHTCWGDFLFGNDIYATSNIYAWDVQLCQDGGTVKSLKETIAKLEARIAALESK